MTLEELVGHMKIEEANRLKDKNVSNPSDFMKANILEASAGSKNRFKKGDNKKAPNQRSFANKGQKPQFKKGGRSDKTKTGCFVCGKPGHRVAECFHRHNAPKGVPKPNQENQANITEDDPK